ncbi:hypothetical protein ACFYOC_25550 [Nocardiopsis alba]|uniref:hypothetical protein n=1 Tax=Nocardiopsis alba TaxID=53437 RepID=UPI0036B6D1FB
MPPSAIESPSRLLTPRPRTPRRAWPSRPCPPSDRHPSEHGLAIIVDSTPALAYSGYRLHAEPNRYVIRLWHRLTFWDLTRLYVDTLTGEPSRLLLCAIGERSWDRLVAERGASFWGSGDRQVYQDCIDPLIRKGLLLPYE